MKGCFQKKKKNLRFPSENLIPQPPSVSHFYVLGQILSTLPSRFQIAIHYRLGIPYQQCLTLKCFEFHFSTQILECLCTQRDILGVGSKFKESSFTSHIHHSHTA